MEKGCDGMNKCITCDNKNKYFPSGCAVNSADPNSDGECIYYVEDIRNCPVCTNEVARDNMVLVKDCHGIPYKFVCPDCVERTKASLRPYSIYSED